MSDLQDLFDKLKFHASNITQAASEISKNAADKVENITKEAKARYSIQKINERIKSNYMTMGECIFKENREEDIERFSDIFVRIESLMEEKEELLKRLQTECDLTICPDCEGVVGKDNCYCPKCGAKISYEYDK